jgi:peptidoglycan hydrolase CwlO-like protein
MNAKSGLLGLIAMMTLMLSACAWDSAQVGRDKDREIMDLRRQVEQTKLQLKAKDDEAKNLEGQLAEAKKLEAQVAGLQDRLKVMDDMMMSKSEDLAKLEAELAVAREAAATAPKGKGKKRKSSKSTEAPVTPEAPAPSMEAPTPAPAPEGGATGKATP